MTMTMTMTMTTTDDNDNDNDDDEDDSDREELSWVAGERLVCRPPNVSVQGTIMEGHSHNTMQRCDSGPSNYHRVAPTQHHTMVG